MLPGTKPVVTVDGWVTTCPFRVLNCEAVTVDGNAAPSPIGLGGGQGGKGDDGDKKGLPEEVGHYARMCAMDAEFDQPCFSSTSAIK